MRVVYSEPCLKQLRKIDKPEAKRIIFYMNRVKTGKGGLKILQKRTTHD